MQAVLYRLAELRTARGSRTGPWTTSPWARLREIVPTLGAFDPRAGNALAVSVTLHAIVFFLFAQIMVPGHTRAFVRDLSSWVIEKPEDIEDI